MTESQRLWEAWLDAYEELVRALPAQATVVCPSHGDGRVHIAYTGDPDSRVGYAIVWCDACLEGIALDRLRVPSSAAMIPYGASEGERVRAIPPDIRLLPPDPYLDGVEEAEL